MCLILICILQVWTYYRNSYISTIYIIEQDPILFTLRESRGHPISSVIKGSQ